MANRSSVLALELDAELLAAFEKSARESGHDVVEVLEAYVRYIARGGEPVDDDLSEVAALSAGGNALDWLADEPDLYTLSDGEPL